MTTLRKQHTHVDLTEMQDLLKYFNKYPHLKTQSTFSYAPISLRPRIPRISSNLQFSGFVVESLSFREVPTSFVYIRSDRFVVNQGLHEYPNKLRIYTNA